MRGHEGTEGERLIDVIVTSLFSRHIFTWSFGLVGRNGILTTADNGLNNVVTTIPRTVVLGFGWLSAAIISSA